MVRRLGLAMLLSALAAPTAFAGWLPARTISPAGEHVRAHLTAAGGDGTVYALVALGDTARGERARTAVLARPRRAAFGDPVPLGGERATDVAALAAGRRGHAVAVVRTPPGDPDARLWASVREPREGFGAPEEVPRAATPAAVAAAVAPDGTALVAYTSLTAEGTASGVYAALRAPEGSWSAPQRLDEHTAHGYELDAAVDARGRFVVAWTESGAQPGAYVATREPGRAFGLPEAVSAPGEHARNAAVAAGGRGGAVVAWESHVRSARRFRVRAAVRGVRREGFSPPRVLSPTGAGEIDVAANDHDGALVVYRLSRRGRSHVRAAVLAGRRGWLRSQQLSGRGRAPLHPRAGFTARGRAFVVWSRFAGRPPARVEAAIRPAGGRFGPARAISPRGVRAPWSPAVAVAPTGEAVAFWMRAGGALDRLDAAGWRPPR